MLQVSKDLPSQLLARFECLDGFAVFADALVFAVDALHGVHEARAGEGGGRDGLEDGGFVFLEGEGFRFGFLDVLVGFLAEGVHAAVGGGGDVTAIGG